MGSELTQEQLGQRLAARRREVRVSVNRAAVELGVSEDELRAIEAGTRVISTLELTRYAYLVCSPIHSFFTDNIDSREDAE